MMNITEKVSMAHPDKIADRIAGALVDCSYSINPRSVFYNDAHCAFEVLIGHGRCVITAETNTHLSIESVQDIVARITNKDIATVDYIEVPQDIFLASNQEILRCGDNGVFAGFPMPKIHQEALDICKKLYKKYPYDGKILINKNTKEKTICWSNVDNDEIKSIIPDSTKINPLGNWTGGVNVDTGVTGRKLSSDFYGITQPLGGGTMHGKDLSKADCSVNIYCFLEAQRLQKPVYAICSIGDTYVSVNGEPVPFNMIVENAKYYITKIGGFEKLAEWGLQVL